MENLLPSIYTATTDVHLNGSVAASVPIRFAPDFFPPLSHHGGVGHHVLHRVSDCQRRDEGERRADTQVQDQDDDDEAFPAKTDSRLQSAAN